MCENYNEIDWFVVLKDLQDNWNKMGGHKTWCHQVLCSYGSLVTLIKPRSFQENILQKVIKVVQVETPKTQYLHLLHMLVCAKGCAQVVGCAKWFEETTISKKIMFITRRNLENNDSICNKNPIVTNMNDYKMFYSFKTSAIEQLVVI